MTLRSPMLWLSLAAVTLAGAALGTASLVLAAQTDASSNAPAVDVGPITPYGETPQEAANKRVVFEWNAMTMVQHQPKRAYDLYVSKSMCDHSHMETMGKRPCAGYDEMLASYIKRHPPGVAAPDAGEIPHLASVDGDMVTMYGKGVDIFRVQDGKITDHWDASPPAAVSIPAHAPGFPAWAMGDRHGPPPMLPETH